MKVLIKTRGGAFRAIPDSAVGRTTQPWFIPDFGSGWRATTVSAARIGRLGKNIAPQFAERYVDAMTLLWVPEADGAPASDFMDGAVVCGNWTEGSPSAALLAAISEASRCATLKTGDVVAVIGEEPAEPLRPDLRVTGDFNGTRVLGFNVK